jgi:hypothetical protein
VTFTNESSKWPSNAKANWYYISQHDDRYIIFADIVNNKLYVTEDEGDTYFIVSVPVTPYTVKFVPGYASWLGPEWSKYAFVHDFLNQTIVVTSDLFRTQTVFNEDVTEAFWDTLEIHQPGVIFFDSVEVGGKVLKKAIPPYDPSHVAQYFNQYFDNFWSSYDYIFVVDEDHEPNRLYVSYNRSDFKLAEFPNNIPGKHYALVDASEKQVFIAVYHDVNNTALYISEEKGQVYSLSLEHLISSSEASWENGNPIFDLHLVEGLKGVLFANQKNPRSRFGASVVSYDKGGRWDSITPPSVDLNGRIINCAPPSCSLHLHMDSSANRGYNGILSRDSAKGLILAMGNTGSTLNGFSSQIKLYMSTNGGYTWVEVDKPYSIVVYQFLDFGSVITYCKRWSTTNQFKYSCDEGLTWTTVSFPNSRSMRVAGMLTELGQKALHATIFGYTYSSGRFAGWYIVGLNFTRSMSRQCTHGDYSLWSPTDEHLDRECLLGEHEEYERRNSTNCCYNGLDYERPVNTYQCNCAIEDYECDFGFQRENINDPCVLIPGMNPYLPPQDCPEGDTYFIGSGYRKVSGDVCLEDPNSYLSRREVPCPVDPPGKLTLLSRTNSAAIGHNVNFFLTQESGGKVKTNYTWDFGDGEPPQLFVGYDQSKQVTHSFSAPGLYNISVVATNDEGRSIGEETVSVLDKITVVAIVGPTVVVADTPVLYTLRVTTQHNMPYQPAQFSWTVNGNIVATTSEPTLLHSFPHGGYTVKCLVSNANGGVSSPDAIIRATNGGNGLVATIMADKNIVGVSEEVTFTVSIMNVTTSGTLSIHVAYSDASADDHTTPTGSQSVSLTHSFSKAGTYSVHVTITSSTSEAAASASTSVEVRKLYKGIAMYRPGFSLNGDGTYAWADLVNTTILFEFRLYEDEAKQHPVETAEFGSHSISVDFGDGGLKQTLTTSVFYHAYLTTGTYIFVLNVSNDVSTVTFRGIVVISGLPTNLALSGPDVVKLGNSGSFSVTTVTSTTGNQNFLNSLAYVWSVYSHKTTATPIYTTSGGNSLPFSFPSSGAFEVKVKGYRQQSTSDRQLVLSLQKTVTALDAIQIVRVDVNPEVALVGEDVSIGVQLFTDAAQRSAYTEAVTVNIVVVNLHSELEVHKDTRSPQVFSGWTDSFRVSNISNHSVSVTADNGIGTITRTASVNVVEVVDTVVLLFDIPTIGQDRNSIWMSQFQESIKQQLTRNLKLDSWRLRVTGKPYSRGDTVERVAAEIKILPSSSGQAQIKEAQQIVDKVRQVPDSHVGYSVPDVSHTVAPVLLVEEEPGSSAGQPSSGVIAAIVVCAVLALVTVVAVMSIIIYVIYRKYRKLEVRYSRLTQTAHMTFEATEDDDDDLSPSPEPSDSENTPKLE